MEFNFIKWNILFFEGGGSFCFQFIFHGNSIFDTNVYLCYSLFKYCGDSLKNLNPILNISDIHVPFDITPTNITIYNIQIHTCLVVVITQRINSFFLRRFFFLISLQNNSTQSLPARAPGNFTSKYRRVYQEQHVERAL